MNPTRAPSPALPGSLLSKYGNVNETTQVNNQLLAVAMDISSPRFGPTESSLHKTQTDGPQLVLKTKTKRKTMATIPELTLYDLSVTVPSPPIVIRSRHSRNPL